MFTKSTAPVETDIARLCLERARSAPPIPQSTLSSSDSVTAAKTVPTSLTRENLLLWNRSHSATDQSVVATEASRSTIVVKDKDARLNAYGVYLETGDIPALLQQHIDQVVMDFEQPDTPSTKRLAVASQGLRNANESEVKEDLVSDLLFKGENQGGEELIRVMSNVIFDRVWLPVAPREGAKQFGALEQPRPDHAIGYIKWIDAHRVVPHLKAGLSKEEGEDVARFAIMKEMHFPFLTCQWKCQEGGTHNQATRQGARDGAAIVRSLDCFYQAAGLTACVVDKAHFSLTTDTRTVLLWVHWSDTNQGAAKPSYYMLQIAQAFLRPNTPRDTSMKDMRKMLRNILKYALSTRLHNIKAAITKLPPAPPSTRSPKRSPTKTLTSSVKSNSGLSNSSLTVPKLDTQSPTETSSSRNKKLRRD